MHERNPLGTSSSVVPATNTENDTPAVADTTNSIASVVPDSAAAIEALVQYIWDLESHHWMCTQCHAVSEIEIEGGLKLPAHPHLKELRQKRKEMLRRKLVEEGRRVEGMREENEILVKILQVDKDGTFTSYM